MDFLNCDGTILEMGLKIRLSSGLDYRFFHMDEVDWLGSTCHGTVSGVESANSDRFD